MELKDLCLDQALENYIIEDNILKNNLPTNTENKEIHFTEDGGIYISSKDSELKQVGVDSDSLEKINKIPQIENNFEIINT